MGNPMAKNLRAKMSKDDNMVVFDVNQHAVKQLAKELGSQSNATQTGETVLARDARQVAEQSVSACIFTTTAFFPTTPHYDEHVPIRMI